MNQFTKAELQYIFSCVEIVTCKNDEFELHEDTINKLEGMIQDYCEHQNDPRFNAMPCAGAPKLCTKCHGFYL